MFKKIFLIVGSVLLANSVQAQPQARVISSYPIYQNVPVSYQKCDNYRPNYNSYNEQNAVIGAVAGGLLGSTSRHHRGTSVVVGALAGAALGSQINNHNYNDGYSRNRCYSVNRYEQRIVGYDVTYKYRGGIYQTRTSYQPGAYITINEPRPVYVEPYPRYVEPSIYQEPYPYPRHWR